jgi:lipoprotein-anchoring transpeptidase ErfK/SrfK
VRLLVALGLLACAASAAAHSARQGNPSILESAAQLTPGQYVWEAVTPSGGPVLVVIDLSEQRAMLYRDGMLIAASTVSTGRKGRRTPTGVFTILEKKVVHRSRTYDDAPMPYMQRLTWKGVAMHAGHVSGHPASHGCIRLPRGFAQRLYAVTTIGTPVTIRA